MVILVGSNDGLYTEMCLLHSSESLFALCAGLCLETRSRQTAVTFL